MSTKYVKFSPDHETDAEAYAAYQEAWISVNAPGAANWAGRYPAGLSAYGPAYDIPAFAEGALKRDTNMNLLVPYFAPPFQYNYGSGVVTVQPVPGEKAYRDYGVIVDTPDFFEFPE